MIEGLAIAGAKPQTVVIDATYLKAYRTISSLPVKGNLDDLIGCPKGGMNTKLPALAYANDRVLSFLITARSANTAARQRFWTTCQKQNNCALTVAIMQTGSGILCRPKLPRPVFWVRDITMS